MSEIEKILQAKYPKAEWLVNYLNPIISSFAISGCEDTDYFKQLSSGDDYFFSRVWEAILYQKFMDQGWNVSGTGEGPDFSLEKTSAGHVLVEATVPSPKGLPPEWLDNRDGVKEMPHEQMVLKWTSSLAAKGSKHTADIKKNTVDANTPFIIAINACRLAKMQEDFGISGYPFSVEAVFPIGPKQAKVNKATGEIGELYQGWRHEIKKPTTGTEIPTDNFLNPDYSHVSALIGCASIFHQNNGNTNLPIFYLVHNPLADKPLPQGWLPDAIEFQADIISNDVIEIQRFKSEN